MAENIPDAIDAASVHFRSLCIEIQHERDKYTGNVNVYVRELEQLPLYLNNSRIGIKAATYIESLVLAKN